MASRPVNVPCAFHLYGMESHPLVAVGGRASPLPDTLVIAPGRYRFHGCHFNLTAPGLYRLLLPTQENRQHIVVGDDPITLLSSIAWLLSHGSRDNASDMAQWMQIARRGKLIITCGDAAQFGVHLLREQSIPARVVQARTLEKLNTYDNGHILLEAWIAGRWILVDLDVKCMFRSRGRRLNLLSFSEKSQTGDYQLEPLAAATTIAVGLFEEAGYDYGLFMETAFCHETRIRRWYERIMQVPIMRHAGERFITGTAQDLRRCRRLYGDKDTALPPAVFRRRFYRPPDAIGAMT